MRTPIRMMVLWLSGALATVAGTQPVTIDLDGLEPEIQEVFKQTLLPQIGLCQAADLDGDGLAEVVIVSHVPLVSENPSGASPGIAFQTHLMLFQRREGTGFPYSLMATRVAAGPLPHPAHVTLQDMGGGPGQEVIWLEEGPDEKERYARAILFQYGTGTLQEAARFESPGGWVRVHDLDRDGISEIIAFGQSEEGTLSPDLLFDIGSGWKSVVSAIRELGSPDLVSFQREAGLEPNGRVTRSVFETVKQRMSEDDWVPVEELDSKP